MGSKSLNVGLSLAILTFLVSVAAHQWRSNNPKIVSSWTIRLIRWLTK